MYLLICHQTLFLWDFYPQLFKTGKSHCQLGVWIWLMGPCLPTLSDPTSPAPADTKSWRSGLPFLMNKTSIYRRNPSTSISTWTVTLRPGRGLNLSFKKYCGRDSRKPRYISVSWNSPAWAFHRDHPSHFPFSSSLPPKYKLTVIYKESSTVRNWLCNRSWMHNTVAGASMYKCYVSWMYCIQFPLLSNLEGMIWLGGNQNPDE